MGYSEAVWDRGGKTEANEEDSMSSLREQHRLVEAICQCRSTLTESPPPPGRRGKEGKKINRREEENNAHGPIS